MIVLSPFRLLNLLFNLYYLILFVRVFGSWIPPTHGSTPWAKILGVSYALTEPLLRPLRRVLHPYQRRLPVDFSPLMLFFALMVLEGILTRMFLVRL